MIESPVKPPPVGGHPVAPPPDPRTRVPDSAPDPAARHEFACRYCGAPLHADQAACLSCGAMVETADDRIGLRRAVTGSAAILLLLGGAVGAAVAGLPNGKHVGKGPIAQVFGKKPATIPPATITPSPRSGSKGVTTPLPTSKTPSKPPPIHKSTSSHSTKSSSNSSSTPSGSSGGSQSPRSSNGGKHKKH